MNLKELRKNEFDRFNLSHTRVISANLLLKKIIKFSCKQTTKQENVRHNLAQIVKQGGTVLVLLLEAERFGTHCHTPTILDKQMRVRKEKYCVENTECGYVNQG